MTAIVIPSEYGYVSFSVHSDVDQVLISILRQVLGTAVVSALYVFSLGFKVGSARRAAKVPYPYGKIDIWIFYG